MQSWLKVIGTSTQRFHDNWSKEAPHRYRGASGCYAFAITPRARPRTPRRRVPFSSSQHACDFASSLAADSTECHRTCKALLNMRLPRCKRAWRPLLALKRPSAPSPEGLLTAVLPTRNARGAFVSP